MLPHLYRRSRTKGDFFSCFRFASVVLIVPILLAHSVRARDYDYPYRDPYLATATTAILSDDGATVPVKSRILRVPGLPGRNALPTLEGRGDASLALYRQKYAAPLLFVVGGLGSNPFFGVSPYLASLFYREGFHVVVLPSPMTWNFALSSSRSGAPGYAPEDARDLYDLMEKVMMALSRSHDVAYTSINFMGVSLGALQGAHLSLIDADRRRLAIDRYLLVNPPVDLAYAIAKIDEWNALKRKFGPAESQRIVSRAISIVGEFSDERSDDPEIFDRLAQRLAGFRTEELQFLIAETLQSQLPELVYVTQVIRSQSGRTATKINMRRQLEEARSFTYTDYNQKIAIPMWRKRTGDPGADLKPFIRQSSLPAIVDRLRGHRRVRILHNADDFLVETRAIEELKKTLGEQMKVFPRGGHLGNLWFPENKEYAIEFFRQP